MFKTEFIRTEEKMTAKVGLVPFAELIVKIKIPDFANKMFPKSSSPNAYDAAVYVTTLILLLTAGGDSLSDVRMLRNDNALRQMLNNAIIPSESAIGDWLRRVGQYGMQAMKQINQHVILAIILTSGIKKVTLVFDPSFIKAEKETAHMTYEGYRGYRPFVAIILELDLIVNYKFKDGNDYEGRLEFIEETIDLMPPGIMIELVLIDAEFYQANIINLLEEKKLGWIMTADQNSATMQAIETIPQNNWEPFYNRHGEKTDREISETVYSMEKTKKAFRLVVMRWKEKKEQGKENKYRYYLKASGINNITPTEIVLKYNPRANGENNIEELKNGFSMRKMPCGTFEPNAVFFATGVLAHNLCVIQKRFILPKEFLPDTIPTIRRKIIEIPGRIIEVLDTVKVLVATTREIFAILTIMRRKIDGLHFDTS
jgi:hypothetical protein